MRGYRSATAVAVAASLLTVASAGACPIYIEPKLSDARQADAVVVGYVTKHVREASPERKASTEEWLANNSNASRAERRNARNATDRARLTVEIDHVITGTVPSRITVYWYRMLNNGPPEYINGGFVFALRRAPPSTSAEAPDTYAVMQGTCEGAMVFRRGGPAANAIREMFGLRPEPLEVPRKTFAQWFKDPPTPWPTLGAYGILGAGVVMIGLIALWPRRRRP